MSKKQFNVINILLLENGKSVAHVFVPTEGNMPQFQNVCDKTGTTSFARSFTNEQAFLEGTVKEFQKLVAEGLATEETMSERDLFKRHGMPQGAPPKEGT